MCQFSSPGAVKPIDHKRRCNRLAWAQERIHLQAGARRGTPFKERILQTKGNGWLPRAAFGSKVDKPMALQGQVCGKSCGQQPVLKEQQSRADGSTFICGMCRKALSCHSQLAAHQTVHTGTRAFHWVSNLLCHRRNHTSKKPFPCELCVQAFSLKDHLVQYRKIHTEHRPYECGNCRKAFKQKSNLLRHQLVHARERPFYCIDCGKAFRTKENLSYHQRIHGGEKPYTCAECGKAFRWPKGFSIHQRLHLMKQFYKCECCGKGFCPLGFFTWHQRPHGRGKV
uniref:C2H2-type domain-containing protein n=1 Tax=Castor canadensis TaxID=51338 RepID=A0A8C0XP32_CASCN